METGFQRGDGGVSLWRMNSRPIAKQSACRKLPAGANRTSIHGGNSSFAKKVWGTWGGSFFEPVAEGFLKRELFIRDSGENHRSFAGFSDVVLKVLLEVQTLAEAFKGQA
jgi:hypothetical protein